jgi:hypothetical protein
MGLNWDEIEAEAAENSFKQYAENGEHTVSVAEVVYKDNGNGWFEMTFEDSEVKYPKLSIAFFGDDKVKRRAHYYKEVMKLLGATEDQARKAVDTCESKNNRADVGKTYTDMFSRLAKKHPKMKIEVRDQYDRDGNPVCSAQGTIYGESVFSKDSGLQFKSNGKQRNTNPTDDPLAGAEDVSEEIDLSDVPF